MEVCFLCGHASYCPYSHLMRPAVLLLVFLSSHAIPTAAQTALEQPAIAGGVTLSGSIGARGYAYPATLLRTGLSESRKAYDWQIELALPLVLGLPGNSVKAGAPEQLGLGATYLRPTQGVFQANGWGELRINIAYAAVTGQLGREGHAGEWGVFALGYDDDRDGVVKTDNRPLAIRSADTGSVSIGTDGGHYIRVAATRIGASTRTRRSRFTTDTPPARA